MKTFFPSVMFTNILLMTFSYTCSSTEYLSAETSYVSVVGEDAYLNWTISNLEMDTTRYIRNPADNASLMVFFSNQLNPYTFDTRATFTGDLLQGIVSFTLSNVTLSDAGKYTFTKTAGTTTLTLGAQVLVVAENPTILGIVSISFAALVGQEYKLNCSTESRSSPSNHNLTMHSQWKQNGVNITVGAGYSVNGTILTISNLERKDNGGKVTCRTFEDQRRSSSESSEFVLNVLYGPDNAQITPSGDLAVSEGENMNITCTGECNPPCRIYQWHKDSLPAVIVSSQSYFIHQITRNDSAVYICTITNANTSKNATAQIKLGVNYGPDVSGIILSPNQTSYNIVESSPIYVNCSADCYPRCQYGWTGPGVGNYGNTGMLSIPEMKRDQAGVLTCTATNPEIMNKSVTANISITVLYGPDSNGIILYPEKSSYEEVESSPIFINCTADCYPSCQYIWTGPGVGYNKDKGVLSIPNIKRNQSGVFTCTATNPQITNKSATATISVTVFYGPDTPLQLFPVNSSYRLLEGATIPDIYCTSNCFPSCQLNWTGPVPSLTGVISLGKVNRSMKGNYTCRGQNPRTQTHAYSNVVTVIIIYGPDSPLLTPSNTDYTLNESNILPNISCSAECFPICTSFWYKEQTIAPVVQGNMLSLGDVFRNDSGKYACKFENMESKAIGERAVQLIVQYPPTIIIESKNEHFNETGFMVNCTAHGMPERYIYSLIQSSLFSEIKIKQVIDKELVFTGSLVHWFRNPSFMDTGVYTCIVSNGILDYMDGSLDKNVSMTVWIKGPPNVTSTDTDFCAEKGESGRLVVEFYNSMLDANVTWTKQRNHTLNKLEIADKYNISVVSTNVTVKFYSVLIQQPGIITTLEIQNVTDEDFGSYQVYLQNSAGNLSDVILKLRPKGRPDAPKDLHIVSNYITSSSVYIEWISGFHGGANQTFFIEYKTQVDEIWTSYSQNVFGGMMQNKYFNITVDDLLQDTLYCFRLRSRNLFGTSEYSVTINATTFADHMEQGASDNRAGLATLPIVLGTCIPIGFLVLLLLVVLCLRKLRRNETLTRESRGDESSVSDHPKDSHVYENDDEQDHSSVIQRQVQEDTAEQMYENSHNRSSISNTLENIYEKIEEQDHSSLNRSPEHGDGAGEMNGNSNESYVEVHRYENSEENNYNELKQIPQPQGDNCSFKSTTL